MALRQQRCCAHQFTVQTEWTGEVKRRLHLTVGFQNNARWDIPDKPDNFIEYGVKRADLHLELTSHTIDRNSGELGAQLPLESSSSVTVSETIRTRKTDSRLTANFSGTDPSIEAKISPKSSETERHVAGKQLSYHYTITRNFYDVKKPSWTFWPPGASDQTCLNGLLKEGHACDLLGDTRDRITFSSEYHIRPNDIVIHSIPGWLCRIIPFSGLMERRLQKMLATENSGAQHYDQIAEAS